ncbi:hypothetical protein TBLA_0J01000 [Henningerozyma blattae CBS 6284]|uniref:Protein kinase domain-containing protein n=1 Tax=Henningerozyma blattae (strain ATCC 34711 / CBS 6284 / DSM 70876 / NBRC 10599 / NRRL Y-10934 / UCD 77-7) TaxID=1071380 RepID=I2H9P6_HENB6|nr:hypothetical protein TBLA_0J01000 [Tetrapisispora blattae CBS 6284]CCH63098.1 hypothetical protein TBLA_0J01000 [Tetrapisispora blattae CBS 6284]
MANSNPEKVKGQENAQGRFRRNTIGYNGNPSMESYKDRVAMDNYYDKNEEAILDEEEDENDRVKSSQDFQRLLKMTIDNRDEQGFCKKKSRSYSADSYSSQEDSESDSRDTIYFQPKKIYELDNENDTTSKITLQYPRSSKSPFYLSVSDSNQGSRTFDNLRLKSNDTIHPNNLDEKHDFYLNEINLSENGNSNTRAPSTMKSFKAIKEEDNDDTNKLSNHRPQSPIYQLNSSNLALVGMEDEYVPDLDFSELVMGWQRSGSSKTNSNRFLKDISAEEGLKSLNHNRKTNNKYVGSAGSTANNNSVYPYDFDYSTSNRKSWLNSMMANNHNNDSSSTSHRYTTSLMRIQPDLSTNVSRCTTSDSMVQDYNKDDILLDSPNDSFLYPNSNHAVVDPIPLPNLSIGNIESYRQELPSTITCPIDLERRDKNINRSFESNEDSNSENNDVLARNAKTNESEEVKLIESIILNSEAEKIDPLTQSFQTFATRRKSSIPASLDSAGSSLTYLPNNSGSIFEELKMTAEQVMELIKKLPPDFISLPYSQRKKMIIVLAPGKNYKILLSLIKRYSLKSSRSNVSLPKGNMRSRHGSIASQFLSSFSPSTSSMASIGSVKPGDQGSQILGHRLGKIIGFGAWGMVRDCIDITSGQNRAMKIVRFKSNIKVRKKVIKEVNIWKDLKHQYILPLLDWSLDREFAMYCLTEKISGGTLYDLVISWDELRRSKIKVEDRCKITIHLITQLLKALEYMHSKFLVHGDIKLENCLLQRGNNVLYWKIYLCDFGMSTSFKSTLNDQDDLSVDREIEMNVISPNSVLRSFSNTIDGKNSLPNRRPSLKSPTSPNTLERTSSGIKRMVDYNSVIKNRKSISVESPLQREGVFRDKTNIQRRVGNKSSKASTSSSISLSNLPSPRNTTLPNSVGNQGINREHSLTIRSPAPDSAIGSLPYASPELLDDDVGYLSQGPGADIWALGVTIYAMLLGRLPFKHEFESRLKAQILAGKYDKAPLREVCNMDKPIRRNSATQFEQFPNLYSVVSHCLLVDVDQRWSLDMINTSLQKDAASDDGLSRIEIL